MSSTVSRSLAALHWQFLHRCPAGTVPAQWRQWLEDRGSLTRRLQMVSAGHFAVQVLRQEFGLPSASEARALKLEQRRWALIREVVLTGYGTPWVYARSVLPLATLTGRLRRLRQLDDSPLGQVLFNDGSMRRDPVQVTRLPTAALPTGLCPQDDSPQCGALRHNTLPGEPPPSLLWGRRSVFHLDNKPLLVAEFFLPGFDPYNAGRSVCRHRLGCP